MNVFFRYLASFLAVVVVLSLHEFAHAFVADKCGDATARYSGRMSLNPLRHFDPLGLVCFAFAGFGWAKPVPINPNNFKNYKWGCFWTSVAGVLVNYLSAFLFYPLYCLVVKYLLPLVAGKYIAVFLDCLFGFLFSYSLSFCVFNLLPLYPLDGFRVLTVFNRKRGKIYTFLRNYGQYILMALILINVLADRITILRYVNLLGFVMNYVVGFLSVPITWIWGFVF